MSANVTIAEIARNAGVGTATVDRVLNGRTGVNSETERKVLQAIDELGTAHRHPGTPAQQGQLEVRLRSARPAAARFLTSWSATSHKPQATSGTSTSPKSPTAWTPKTRPSSGWRWGASAAATPWCWWRRTCRRSNSPSTNMSAPAMHVVTLFSDVAGSMRQAHIGADSRAAGRTAGLLAGPHGAAWARSALLLLSTAHPYVQ
jgi:LacI family transcriptional regulator